MGEAFDEEAGDEELARTTVPPFPDSIDNDEEGDEVDVDGSPPGTWESSDELAEAIDSGQ